MDEEQVNAVVRWLRHNDVDIATWSNWHRDEDGISVVPNDVFWAAMEIFDYVYKPLEYMWGDVRA